MTAPFSFVDSLATPIQKVCLSVNRKFGNPYLKNESKIIFVCGANSNETHISNRERFLKYAETHLTDFKFFRAEDVFNAFGSASLPDLLSVEDSLGAYSDCIIVLCESESAFAELGAFALSDALVKQLLIVNNKDFKRSTSFINLGPIAKADKQSKFAPTVYADFAAILRSAPDIRSRLNEIPHQRRKRLPFDGKPSFERLPSKLKLLVLADLISLFSPVRQKELIEVLKMLFAGEKKFDIGVELALGQSLKFFCRQEDPKNRAFLVSSLEETVQFIDYTALRRPAVRAKIIRAYFQGDRDRLQLVSKMENLK